jgi:hypothetical protein
VVENAKARRRKDIAKKFPGLPRIDLRVHCVFAVSTLPTRAHFFQKLEFTQIRKENLRFHAERLQSPSCNGPGVEMEANDIKRMYEWIQNRVNLAMNGEGIVIAFDEPGSGDFTEAGFTSEAVELTLHSDWWAEMATDIVETPDFAEPNESPEQVLQYARDVVKEYVAKRLYT